MSASPPNECDRESVRVPTLDWPVRRRRRVDGEASRVAEGVGHAGAIMKCDWPAPSPPPRHAPKARPRGRGGAARGSPDTSGQSPGKAQTRSRRSTRHSRKQPMASLLPLDASASAGPEAMPMTSKSSTNHLRAADGLEIFGVAEPEVNALGDEQVAVPSTTCRCTPRRLDGTRAWRRSGPRFRRGGWADRPFRMSTPAASRV